MVQLLFLGLMVLVVCAAAAAISSGVAAGDGGHRRRVRGLNEFAQRLRGGFVSQIGFARDGTATVLGQLEGRQVRVDARLAPQRVVQLQLHCDTGLGSFEVARSGWRERLAELRGGRGEAAAGPRGLAAGASRTSSRYSVRDGCEHARGVLFQREELGAALEALFAPGGLTRLVVGEGSVYAEQGDFPEGALDADALEETLRRMLRVAAVCERREVSVTLKGRSFGWTGGSRTAVLCPYCREDLDLSPAGADALSACERCRTLHHVECLAEAGGCTIFGCGAPRRVQA